MSKEEEEEAQGETPIRAALNHLARESFAPALQFALECDGAPGRCQRRNCRSTGECHVRMRGQDLPSCGGGLTAENLERAAELALFAAMMGASMWLKS